jgi:hypothetical protein
MFDEPIVEKISTKLMQSDGTADGTSDRDNYQWQMEACQRSKKGML